MSANIRKYQQHYDSRVRWTEETGSKASATPPPKTRSKADANTSAQPDETCSHGPTRGAAPGTDTDQDHDQPDTAASTPMLLETTGKLSRRVRNTSTG